MGKLADFILVGSKITADGDCSHEIKRCSLVLEKTLESPLDCKEIQPLHPKGDQSWVFIGRTDIEAETSMLWPPDAKSWFIWKDPDAGKDWGQEGKRTTEDEMVGWHHQLNGHEFEQTPGDSGGQRTLACCTVHGVVKSRTWPRDWTTPNKNNKRQYVTGIGSNSEMTVALKVTCEELWLQERSRWEWSDGSHLDLQ